MKKNTRDFLIEHGYQDDSNNEHLLKLFSTTKKFKEAYITASFKNPPMILVRGYDKNVSVDLEELNDGRLVLKRKDDTFILDLVLDEIKNCIFENYGKDLHEFIFDVRDAHHSILVRE